MTMAVRKTDEELTDKRKCKIGGLITDWGGGNRAIWPKAFGFNFYNFSKFFKFQNNNVRKTDNSNVAVTA